MRLQSARSDVLLGAVLLLHLCGLPAISDHNKNLHTPAERWIKLGRFIRRLRMEAFLGCTAASDDAGSLEECPGYERTFDNGKRH